MTHSVRRKISTEVLKIPQVGCLAPDFTLRAMDGCEVSLGDYQGKKVVVFMWASW